YTGEGRAWGALGGNLALVGNPDTPQHPQVVGIASVNSSLRFNVRDALRPDNVDVRAGLAFEFAPDPAYRLSLVVLHEAGFVGEGAADPSLAIPSLNNDSVFARLLFDLGFFVRVGGTIFAVVHSTPSMKFVAANEFLELFPLGGLDLPTKPSPYLALG